MAQQQAPRQGRQADAHAAALRQSPRLRRQERHDPLRFRLQGHQAARRDRAHQLEGSGQARRRRHLRRHRALELHRVQPRDEQAHIRAVHLGARRARALAYRHGGRCVAARRGVPDRDLDGGAARAPPAQEPAARAGTQGAGDLDRRANRHTHQSVLAGRKGPARARQVVRGNDRVHLHARQRPAAPHRQVRRLGGHRARPRPSKRRQAVAAARRLADTGDRAHLAVDPGGWR